MIKEETKEEHIQEKPIRLTAKGEEIQATQALSPSKINQWFQCPRSYYYNYMMKIKQAPNIHLAKGSVVHKTLEDFYRGYNANPKRHLLKLFKAAWKTYDNVFKMLEMPPAELKAHKKDAVTMIFNFYAVHKRKMDGAIIQGKAENEHHAFFLTKPKFKELYVKDDNLKVRGYIDRISQDYDGLITLADYKTSSRYGVGLSGAYKRQLAIYALLYNNDKGIMADFVSIIFLRYGEEVLLEVTPSVLKYARDTIDYVWTGTRSTAFEDYPKKEGRLCKWCSFNALCSGSKEFEKKKNVEKMKKALKKTK